MSLYRHLNMKSSPGSSDPKPRAFFFALGRRESRPPPPGNYSNGSLHVNSVSRRMLGRNKSSDVVILSPSPNVVILRSEATKDLLFANSQNLFHSPRVGNAGEELKSRSAFIQP